MSSQPDRFDLIVVGAGSGTTVSAAAAEAGETVDAVRGAIVHPALPEVLQRAFSELNLDRGS